MKFTYTITLTIDEAWIADGFDLRTDDEDSNYAIAEAIRSHFLPYAYSHEVEAKVIKAPKIEKVKKVQGYQVA